MWAEPGLNKPILSIKCNYYSFISSKIRQYWENKCNTSDVYSQQSFPLWKCFGFFRLRERKHWELPRDNNRVQLALLRWCSTFQENEPCFLKIIIHLDPRVASGWDLMELQHSSLGSWLVFKSWKVEREVHENLMSFISKPFCATVRYRVQTFRPCWCGWCGECSYFMFWIENWNVFIVYRKVQLFFLT